MIKPIKKPAKLGTKRQTITGKVVKISVVKEWSHNTQNAAAYDCGLYVKLDNGYSFYTPKRLQILEGGVRGESGVAVGYGLVINSDEEWFVVESKTRFYNEQYETYITTQRYYPKIVKDEYLTIKGTPVKNQYRLNRVKLISQN